MNTSLPSDEGMLRTWRLGTQVWRTGDVPRLMGIVNVTPDSFSDGGQWLNPKIAVEHAMKLAADGADLLDVGGESTRPGADPISAEEELRRVLPVIEQLSAQTMIPVSIDTSKAIVAREALAAGASVVNDISGLTFDPEMIDVCAGSNCGVILMHIQGTPKTMQINPYYQDAVMEISQWLQDRCQVLMERGIDVERLMIDPGIGFGKTPQHNLDILSNIKAFRGGGRPVLIGHSRKGFLKKLIGRNVDERLAGTIGVSIALAAQHVDLLRVHDVASVRDALAAWHQIAGS